MTETETAYVELPRAAVTLRQLTAARRRFDRAKAELEDAMLDASDRGFPIRAIADASGVASSSVHRLIVRRRS